MSQPGMHEATDLPASSKQKIPSSISPTRLTYTLQGAQHSNQPSLTAAVSLNASVLAATLLSSTLSSPVQCFSLMNLAFGIFGLTPVIRSLAHIQYRIHVEKSLKEQKDSASVDKGDKQQHKSLWIHWHFRITIGMFAMAAFLLLFVSFAMVFVFVFVCFIVTIICPLWLKYVQRYKL
jgi:cation transport ATPase